uniref:Putative secreted protein n=1 Tax=Anopheles marajoara TaxID=58244 RepID=A0A2M4CF20_9DIPT
MRGVELCTLLPSLLWPWLCETVPLFNIPQTVRSNLVPSFYSNTILCRIRFCEIFNSTLLDPKRRIVLSPFP